MQIAFRSPLTIPINAWGEPDVGGFTRARVSSPFGMRNGYFHYGIDIGNYRLGDRVVATAAGVVYEVGNLRYPWSQPTTRWPSGNYGGLMIVIRHSANVFTTYCHLRRTLVAHGSKVSAGQAIGEIGATGSATDGGGHLHHEIAVLRVGDTSRQALIPITRYRDPWPYITGRLTITDGALEADLSAPRLPGAVYTLYGTDGPLPAFRTKDGARLREFPSTVLGGIIHEFNEGAVLRPYARVNAAAYEGGIANGSPDWLELRGYTGAGFDYGFVHTSTVSVVNLPVSDAASKLARIERIIEE